MKYSKTVYEDNRIDKAAPPFVSDEMYSIVDKTWNLGIEHQNPQLAAADTSVGLPAVY